jgi:hypothetical protein
MNVFGARTSDRVFSFCAYAILYRMAMVLISRNEWPRFSYKLQGREKKEMIQCAGNTGTRSAQFAVFGSGKLAVRCVQ